MAWGRLHAVADHFSEFEPKQSLVLVSNVQKSNEIQHDTKNIDAFLCQCFSCHPLCRGEQKLSFHMMKFEGFKEIKVLRQHLQI